MEPSTPTLPSAEAVAKAVQEWAAVSPRLTAFLNAGLTPPRALTRWGLELLRGNQIADATTVLRGAVALAPLDPVGWANYGMAHLQGNSPVEAAACFEKSVALQPHQADTWLMLGLARKKLGHWPAAEAACRTVLQQDPASTVAWQTIAIIKEEQRDFAGAVVCLNTCLTIGGNNAAILANLGKLHHQLGQIVSSHEAYTKAFALEPANVHYRLMARRTAFLRQAFEGGSMDEAIARYKSSRAPGEAWSEDDLTQLLQSTFSMLCGFGHLDAAARTGRKLLQLTPSNPSRSYLVSAVTGERTFDRCPTDYVIEHFDAFAEGFDAQLVGALGYDIPQKLCAAVREVGQPEHRYDTLDAGCGTGLCGPLLRPISRVLTGVDLSPKMLAQSGRRGVYDALVCEDLPAFLRRSVGQFDLIVSADTIVYLGDLAPVFTAAAVALRPGGLFAFSTELWTGAGYRLLPAGRFAHSPAYVRETASQDFSEVLHTATTIRWEATARLPGDLFIFRRTSTIR